LILIDSENAGFGQILRSFSLHSGAIIQRIHALHPYRVYAKIFSALKDRNIPTNRLFPGTIGQVRQTPSLDGHE